MTRTDPARGKATHCRLAVAAWVLLLGCAEVNAQSWLEKAKEFLGTEDEATRKSTGKLSTAEIGAGLREALTVGTERVVDRLSVKDGFNADSAIHIPLPHSLAKVQSALDALGMDALLDDLELRMNRAAEAATPKAKTLFVQAIKDLTMEDVMAIYRGPDDAATRYLESRMSKPLAAEMRPIVDDSLADAGAMKVYEDVIGRYETVPFAPKVDTDLTGYVVEKSMDGIFHYLAREEAAIRKDPVKRTNELLRKVFGGT